MMSSTEPGESKQCTVCSSVLGGAMLEHLPDNLRRRKYASEANVLERLLLMPDDHLTPEGIETILVNANSPFTIETLTADAVLGLAHGLSSLSNTETPRVIASVINATLELTIDRFVDLPSLKRAAFVAFLTPGRTTMQFITDTAELFESLRVTEHINESSTLYLVLMHDEGNDKTTNKILVYAAWFNTTTGKIEPAVLLGCLDTGKTGKENAAAIKNRLRELGLDGNSVQLLIQTVDGAGKKVMAELEDLGLVFTIVCECHNVNKCGEQFDEAFPQSGPAGATISDLCFRVIHTIRHTIGINKFYSYAEKELRKVVKSRVPATERGTLGPVIDQVIKARGRDRENPGFQKSMNTPDVATRVRWNSIEHSAVFITSPESHILIDGRLQEYLFASDVTARGIILHGIQGSYDHNRTKWFARANKKKSKEAEKYGKHAMLNRLAAELTDPFMLAQLDLAVEVFKKVLAPSLAVAKGFERAGGGGCEALKIRTLRLEKIEQIRDDLANLDCVIKNMPLLGDKAENFYASTGFYIQLMLQKSEEHWREAARSNLPLALADPFLAQAISQVLVTIFVERQLVDGVDVVEILSQNLVPVPSYEPIIGFKLGSTPSEVADRCKQLWAAGNGIDPTKERWWGLFDAYMPNFLSWARAGCPAQPGRVDGFTELLSKGFAIARLTTLVVEAGVNQMSRAGKSVAGSTTSALGQHIRLAVYEVGRRIRAIGKGNVTTARVTKKAKSSREESLVTYTRGPESKAAIFHTQAATSEYTSAGFANYDNAKKKARERGKTRARTEQDEAYIRNQLEREEQRNQKHVDNFEAKTDDARQDVQTSHASFRSFHLQALSDGKYTKAKMIETLITRYKGDSVDFDDAKERDALTRLPATGLRPLMVEEFYGDGWDARVAPSNVRRQMQDTAVAKAKEMCTDELAPDGKAWAWRTA